MCLHLSQQLGLRCWALGSVRREGDLGSVTQAVLTLEVNQHFSLDRGPQGLRRWHEQSSPKDVSVLLSLHGWILKVRLSRKFMIVGIYSDKHNLVQPTLVCAPSPIPLALFPLIRTQDRGSPENMGMGRAREMPVVFRAQLLVSLGF